MYAKTTLFALLVLLVFATRGAWRMYQKAVIARAERIEAEHSLAELESRAKEFEANIMRLKSERGIEEEIRQKYTVARPNEEMVVVVDETSKKGKNDETQREQSLWGKFLSVFGL